jgi:hypothetical protein
MLAQAETKSKAPSGNRNGRTDKSDGLDPQFARGLIQHSGSPCPVFFDSPKKNHRASCQTQRS